VLRSSTGCRPQAIEDKGGKKQHDVLPTQDLLEDVTQARGVTNYFPYVRWLTSLRVFILRPCQVARTPEQDKKRRGRSTVILIFCVRRPSQDRDLYGMIFIWSIPGIQITTCNDWTCKTTVEIRERHESWRIGPARWTTRKVSDITVSVAAVHWAAKWFELSLMDQGWSVIKAGNLSTSPF
jgi:hypothetical protein